MPEDSTTGLNESLGYRPAPRPETAAELFAQLRGPQHRRALGRAITLLESTQEEDRFQADALIDLARSAAEHSRSFRLGVSGTPGVGKSTFIESFGLRVLEKGHRLAVLAVDPSSSLSGGSILGDKTRMEALSRHPAAFIRPSPNAGHLGGVGAASRATVLLCEAAGYDYIIVETVGVGQAEWRVHGITDAFLLLAQPAAGDELQGIKRGILELADHIAVNKADALPAAARESARQLRQGLHLAPPRADGWTVEVSTISAHTGQGLEDLLERLDHYAYRMRQAGIFQKRRDQQTVAWLRESCEQRLNAQLLAFLRAKYQSSDGLQRIIDEHSSLSSAVNVILAEFIKTTNLS
ncbi:methylmalonyl Co-A mutase-associated GTPase MeaB [Neolewinella lacunae]|uniref:methylmalonyl Co-A mutase-associated GTPase MeaB n=1 Tax=Neolewinella lacunae TaxID=1517758 RepID=UPI0025B37B5E|nr:methylmalonyl Co-A mutase-associated GTPase MeaB [Neolewinella lacunae]MDN3633303.1 methylmalonyl Co-A mutase-associated GTPase MeaB [Neolewinella lacunae]